MAEFARYSTQAEIEEVVRRFEACEYTPEEFVHAKHLTVAAYYFRQFDRETAENSMHSGLRKFIGHHGRNGYHETITRFWLHMVKHSVRRRPESELTRLINEVVQDLGDKELIHDYFSRVRLYSSEAKMNWIEPDLKPLP